MKPPKRICEDPELPLELRVDLTRAQRATRAYDHLAKLDALRAALGQGSPPEGENPTTVSGGDGPPLGGIRPHSAPFKAWPWGWKMAVIAALGGVGTTAVWPAPNDLRRMPAAVLAPASPATAASSVEVSTSPGEPTTPPPTQTRGSDAEAVHATSRVAAGAASGREVDQLVRIRARLQHDPASAYRLAKQAEREFPEGALREEREALALLALAKLGRRDEARLKARDFLARHPQSTMRNVVQALLAP